ncbi:MAG: alpha-ketoacid dehydrogenase subunit beta [Anaerolineales bacterium]|nr:alpha-ketoacid dehydrogenase subunit beta [Anaerolineales bacterium]
MPEINMRQALNQALREELLHDPTVHIWGENVEGVGGGFLITMGLSNEFGERVKDSPLAETAIVGAAVGAAYCGLRPVVELMFADFTYICMDEIVNKMAKVRYSFGAYNDVKLPIVVRMKVGGYFAQSSEHSQTPLAHFMHTPGLKLVFPTTPYEAKGLLKTAIRDDNPVLFFEHIIHFAAKGEVPEEEYFIPFEEANIRREGSDVTVVAIGYMVDLALEAAEELAKEGVSLEVIDPRTLEPLDMDTIMGSIEKTGRVVVVDEDVTRCGIPAEILMQIFEQLTEAGKTPVPMARVGAANTPIPYSPELEKAVLPSADKIIEAVKKVLV